MRTLIAIACGMSALALLPVPSSSAGLQGTKARPDLLIRRASGPRDVTRGRPFTVAAAIAETGGVRAKARLSLLDGASRLASKDFSVAPGRSTVVSFRIELATARVHRLQLRITDSRPTELDSSNNGYALPVRVDRYDADGVVSTDHWLATNAGVAILRAGGNAIDAAAAIQFVLNVVDPNLGGIGGGVNVLVRLANGKTYAVDGREMAPGATTPTTYRGKTVASVGVNGYSVGVPGTVRAIDVMLERWGTMPLARTLQPAIALAEHGIPVGAFLAQSSADPRVLDMQPEAISLVRRPDGTPLQRGDTLVERDLAKTFRLLASRGADAFYRGPIAEAIVQAQRRLSPTKPVVGGEGRMTLDDLARYRVKVEPPLALDYHGYRVFGAPPSTCGGLVTLETLGLLQASGLPIGDSAAGYGFGQPATLHATLEALRLALADRDMWIGDDDVVEVPARGLLSPAYLADRSKLITATSRIPEPTQPGNPFSFQAGAASRPISVAGDEHVPAPGHTTHFSVIDRWGNVVSFTSTVTDGFGSGILVPGYGFFLNDGLSNFNLTPRADVTTGNPGANDPAPYKRDMGNLSPTIVVRSGEPVAATGTYGADFIPSLVVNVLLDLVDHHLTLQQAVDAPRMWVAQARGDAAVNVGISLETIDAMRALGDRVSRTPAGGSALGSLSSVGVSLPRYGLRGAADRRRIPDARAVVLERS